MPREDDFRRPRFSPGLSIRLADGQSWILPDPCCPGIAGAEYESLLAALGEAEDDGQRRRAELALAIYLLDFNYRLSPADFAAILDCPSVGDRLARSQEALRAAATAHSSRARADVAPRWMGVAPWPGPRRSGLAHPAN